MGNRLEKVNRNVEQADQIQEQGLEEGRKDGREISEIKGILDSMDMDVDEDIVNTIRETREASKSEAAAHMDSEVHGTLEQGYQHANEAIQEGTEQSEKSRQAAQDWAAPRGAHLSPADARDGRGADGSAAGSQVGEDRPRSCTARSQLLNTAPDFSLQKYASLSETGPKGVLVQQQAFWRQINQWGKLYGGAIHFIYEYNPSMRGGNRLKLVMRFDSPTKEGKTSIEQIMKASVMAPYYDQLVLTDSRSLSETPYAWQVNLIKRERLGKGPDIVIESSGNENEKFYTVSEWEMGDEARLYSLLKMMEVMEEHCAYCVSIYPVDYVDTLDRGLMYILPHLRFCLYMILRKFFAFFTEFALQSFEIFLLLYPAFIKFNTFDNHQCLQDSKNYDGDKK